VCAFERSKETQPRFADVGSALAPIVAPDAFTFKRRVPTADEQP